MSLPRRSRAIALVVLNVAQILPIPDSWESEINESRVAQAIIGPTALPQRTFEALAPDNALQALDVIQSLFGTSRAVPDLDERLPIPPAKPDEVRQVVSELQRFG